MSCSCKNKQKQDFTKKPDEPCVICLHKHFSFAYSLMREVGYEEQNTDLIVGNLEGAAEHCRQLNPVVAEQLREARHLWQFRKFFQAENLLKTLSPQIAAMREGHLRQNSTEEYDVLIPFRERSSAANGEELRMALRSIERNLVGYRKIWVAGPTLPKWARNVEFVRVPDLGKNKQERINHAIVSVLSKPECAENVIFWADDNALLLKTRCDAFPRVRNSGDLSDVKPSQTWWDNTRHATAEALKARGLPTVDYEAHTPVLFRRDDYLNMQREFDFTGTEPGLCYISLYCNRYPVEKVQMREEVKATVTDRFGREVFNGKRFLGYNDNGVKAGVLQVLGEALNTPCRYEHPCDHEVVYPASPSIGVVVGTHGSPDLIELQLHYLCKVNGLPVLVHDDASPERGAIEEVCRRYTADGFDVTFASTGTNHGHRRGDVMAFAAALEWAEERGFDLLYKTSRRFVICKEWAENAKTLAVTTGGITFSNFTQTERLGFRTEFFGVHVTSWSGQIDRLRKLAARPIARLVEAEIHDIARELAGICCDQLRFYMIDQKLATDQQGYIQIPWMGTDRSNPPEGVLWHHRHKQEDYIKQLNKLKEEQCRHF